MLVPARQPQSPTPNTDPCHFSDLSAHPCSPLFNPSQTCLTLLIPDPSGIPPWDDQFSTMSFETYWENFQQAFWQISPYAYSAIGIAISIGVSVLGAAWGILITGSSLIGAAIKAPRITSKNLISVIFCEAVAIYGVIVAIILQTKLESVGKARLHSPEALRSGYAIFNSGIIVVRSGCSGSSLGLSYRLKQHGLETFPPRFSDFIEPSVVGPTDKKDVLC
ncbi:unnamed protein product [Closterium sp. Yama58-4]|nr:unnamed protein product [Closterium sp. Yama58-4]